MNLVANDVRKAFLDALIDAGFEIDGLPAMDGCMHRARVEGDRAGRQSGSYIGFLDGWPAGHYQNFRAGIKKTWRFALEHNTLSRSQLREMREHAARQRARRAQQILIAQKRVANRLRWRVRRSHFRAAERDHPYVIAKQLRAAPLPLQDACGRLVILAHDVDGTLWSLQTIRASGTKRFPADGRIHGVHHLLNSGVGRSINPERPLVVAEGWATAATIAMLTGAAVAAAFSASNLTPVAESYRRRYPTLPILIASDNDHRTARRTGPDGERLPNVGAERAVAAARAVDGTVAMPIFADDDPGSDWNDRFCRFGADVVRDELLTALSDVRRPRREITATLC
jgi:phage/plasmid primase-like uncharacterized protein